MKPKARIVTLLVKWSITKRTGEKVRNHDEREMPLGEIILAMLFCSYLLSMVREQSEALENELPSSHFPLPAKDYVLRQVASFWVMAHSTPLFA